MKRIIFITLLSAISILMIGQNAFKYPIIIGTNGGANGQITLNGSTSGSVVIKSNVVAGAGTVFQLPANNGTNGYLLSTDGAGVLSWIVPPVTMTYPGAGIPISTGAGWAGSLTNNSTNWDNAYTDRLKWDGGSLDLVASTGRSSLGGTTIGQAFFTLANPSAITFPRINADNSVTALSAANFRTATATVGTADTATMLNNYINKADTSAMLLRYINKADTSAMLNDYINKADTADMLDPYASRQNINDSLDVLKAEAEVGISEADSLLRTTGGYSTYNNHLNGIENSWVHKEFADSSGIKAFPVAPYYSFSNGGALTSGRCYYILYHVISTITVTGIKWSNAGAGDYVAKDYNGFGLYSISGETYTLIDSTTNNGDLWKGTALTLQTTNWANGAHVLTPGYYIVAAVWSAESAPAAAPQPYYIANVAAVFHNLFRVNGLGGNHRMVSYKNATTELPLTIGTADMTAAGTYIYAFLLY